jgi:catalase
VQRTYLTARSTEFDAVIIAAAAAPAPDAAPGLDAKAGAPGGALDPRAVLLLTEAFRHAKAIASLDSAAPALAAAGIPQDAPGIVSGNDVGALVKELTGLMAAHRVWERFPAASA